MLSREHTKAWLPGIILRMLMMGGLFFVAGCTYYNGPPNNHFDGTRFTYGQPDHSLTDMIKWWWQMETVAWPDWVEDPRQPPPPVAVGSGELRVTYVNHATVLIQMDGINILTDPFWSHKAGPLPWLGVKRVRAPGVRLEDLPDIHIILISHDHYDHLDLPTLRKLAAAHKPLVVAGLGMQRRLANIEGLNVATLDWWQAHHIKDKELSIVGVPCKHNSGRGLFDKNRTLWTGYVLMSPHGNVLFMGDTAFGEFFQEIKTRCGSIRLAILPIGSYEKRWFMRNSHMNPDDAVKAHLALDAHQSVGIHFGTLKEHPEQTITAHEYDLTDALQKHVVPEDRFWILAFGEGRRVSQP